MIKNDNNNNNKKVIYTEIIQVFTESDLHPEVQWLFNFD